MSDQGRACGLHHAQSFVNRSAHRAPTLVSPREVFRGVIIAGAVALVAAHNHPSGDPSPSAADIQVTRRLREAANTLEIDLLDHVICGDAKADPRGVGHFSFREAGLL
jgi:DNA repair protein RadC